MNFSFLRSNAFTRIISTDIWLVCLLVTAAFLRFYNLDFQSLWIDEINSIVESDPQLSFKETYNVVVSNDSQPPIYFFFLKFLFTLFGYNSIVLRSFSALLGVAAIYAIYLLGTELYTKRTGLIAALFLNFNYLHIYYSQEARPYTFLILFSILSFYTLVRFIKKPGSQNAVLYGINAALMLYGHLFGLFILVSQVVILVYNLFIGGAQKRMHVFKNSLLAGTIIVVMFLPVIPTLIVAGKATTSWIARPDVDVFNKMFDEFFGFSEFVIALMIIFLMLFFVKASGQPSKEEADESSSNNPIPSSAILLTWVVIGLFIPLVRSYLVLPMIVTRYFLGLLPAIILMAAAGLSSITNKRVGNLLIMVFIVFSVNDIFVIRKYYWSENKTDLRGAAQFVNENRNPGDIVASRIGWHYNYYLSKGSTPFQLINKNFDGFMAGIMSDTTSLKPFWYIDAGSKMDEPSGEYRSFLNRKFFITKKIDLYGSCANRYSPIGKNFIPVNLAGFSPVKPNEWGQIAFYWRDSTRTGPFYLDKGVYRIHVGGSSKPEKPIKGINAHITIKLNGQNLGGVFLSEKAMIKTGFVNYLHKDSGPVMLELLYDNDANDGGEDRNAFVSIVYFEKQD